MEEKSIGQFLQTAREQQNLSISDTQRLAKIKKRYLRALENDEYDEIPGASQARSLLKRYAEFLELDVDVIMDAYDSDSPLTVYEIETSDARTGRMNRRRKSKKKNSYLPLFYLLLLALGIIIFVVYTVWSYTNSANKDKTDQSYRVASESSQSSNRTSESSSSSSSSDSQSSSNTSAIELSGADGEYTANISGSPQEVTVTLSVTDASSWVALANTELAEGVTLSPENQTVTAKFDKTAVPSTILTLGTVEGVTVKINDQELDLSSLTASTANITLNFN